MKTYELLAKINADLDAGDMLAATESFNLEQIAMEGFFGTKNSAESILKSIAKTVRKAKTVEALDDMLAVITEEVKKYNDTWASAKEVAAELKAKGEEATKEDQKAAKAKLAELDKQLKKTTDILKLSTPGDSEEAYMAACKELQTILDGAQTLINEKKAELEGDEPATESTTEDLAEGTIFGAAIEGTLATDGEEEEEDDDEDDDFAIEGFLEDDYEPATEGAATYSLKVLFSSKKKAAKAATKAAKAAIKAKNYSEAIAKYKEAQKIYGELKDKLAKIPEMEIASFNLPMKDGKNQVVTQTQNYSLMKAYAKNYFVNKIFNCDEAIMKIEEKQK